MALVGNMTIKYPSFYLIKIKVTLRPICLNVT